MLYFPVLSPPGEARVEEEAAGSFCPVSTDPGISLPVIEANSSRIVVFHEQVSVSHTLCAWVSMNYDPPFAKQYGLWDSAVYSGQAFRRGRQNTKRVFHMHR